MSSGQPPHSLLCQPWPPPSFQPATLTDLTDLHSFEGHDGDKTNATIWGRQETLLVLKDFLLSWSDRDLLKCDLQWEAALQRAALSSSFRFCLLFAYSTCTAPGFSIRVLLKSPKYLTNLLVWKLLCCPLVTIRTLRNLILTDNEIWLLFFYKVSLLRDMQASHAPSPKFSSRSRSGWIQKSF